MDARLRATKHPKKLNPPLVVNYIEENMNMLGKSRNLSQTAEKTPLEKLAQANMLSIMQGYDGLNENFKDHLSKIKRYQDAQKKQQQIKDLATHARQESLNILFEHNKRYNTNKETTTPQNHHQAAIQLKKNID